VILVRTLVGLATTIAVAPALAYVAFATLSAETFAPGETLAGLVDWQEGFLLHGDLGFDDYYDKPVTAIIRAGLPVDLTMLACGLGFGLLSGIAGGLFAAARPGSWGARGMAVLAGVAVSLPVYWLGFVVLMLFAANTGMIVKFPFVSGADQYEGLLRDPVDLVQSLWVPCLVVGTPVAAGVQRMTLAASREVLGEDFVRTARAKGMAPSRVFARHVLPVALTPVLVLLASQVNLAIANVALMQTAFNIDGSFRYVTRALDNGNTMLMQALVLEGCVLIALANAAADLLQARLDPRLRGARFQPWA
jgi:ABC-type dipeptide/oligopeptide/nickel transport system permease component